MTKKTIPQGVDIVTLMGPTASGKTSVAVQLAHMLGGVLFSADSRQVYKGMDIGTGKDLQEYVVEGSPVPHFLIDICEPGERYNVHRYREDFFEIFNALPREVPKVLCGGTGQYVETVLGGFEMPDVPENLALRSELEQLATEQLQERAMAYEGVTVADAQNRRRLIRAIEVGEYFRTNESGAKYLKQPKLFGPIVCLDVTREVRRERITVRLKSRLEGGMVEEVEGLLQFLQPEQLIYYGLEYKFVTEYLLGEYDFDEMFRRLEIAIHQFSKRQMTWIRGMERRGFEVTYVQPQGSPRETAEVIFAQLF